MANMQQYCMMSADEKAMCTLGKQFLPDTVYSPLFYIVFSDIASDFSL